MATITRSRLTQAEFMALQEEGAGVEYERGRLIPLMPVEGQQSTAWSEVHLALGQHVRRHRLGLVRIDLLTYLDPDGEVRYFPDIVYLSNDARDRFDGSKVVGPPTLVVEVTAPDADEREEGEKKQNYHAAGVPWYWIVNLRRGHTEEYQWAPEEYQLLSEIPLAAPFRPALFPGLEIVAVPGESSLA
jgi:Uma2 family endonuclease